MTNEQEQIAITKYDLYYESRMTRMETIAEELKQSVKEIREDVREIRTDLKWFFGIVLGLTCIIFGIMARGFHWFS
jgi:cell division protein ZapA (FtsZ GTPase activity inhibitor)